MDDLPGSIGKYVTSHDNTQIFYSVLPALHSKKTLVFLHGLGGDSAGWDKERKALQEIGYASVGIDLRGHGLSDRPKYEGSYHIDNFVQDIIAVLKQEKLEKVILVGHSFGGMVCLKLEAEYPATARALILVDSSYKVPVFGKIAADHRIINSIVTFLAKHAPMIHDEAHINTAKFYGTTDFNARFLLSQIIHTSLRSYFMVSQEILHINEKELLKKIMVPTLILAATNDVIFPPDVAEELHEKIKGSEINFIEGGTHLSIINKPGEIVEDMVEFLQKINY